MLLWHTQNEKNEGWVNETTDTTTVYAGYV